jgi:hypothetical protein
MMQKAEIERGQEYLRMHQSGGFKVWTQGEVEDAIPNPVTREISSFISERNELGDSPSKPEITKAFNIRYDGKEIAPLEKLGIIFGVTIPDVMKFFGIRPAHRRTNVPEQMPWVDKYLREEGFNSGSYTWKRIMKNTRSPRYARHYVSNVIGEGGKPCYLLLGLHIKNK